MKAKLDFKSKRTIIIAAIIGVLAVGAGIGGYFYAKGNNQAGATNVSQETTAINGEQATENPTSNTDDGGNNGGDITPTTENDTPEAGTDGATGTTNGGAETTGGTGTTGRTAGTTNRTTTAGADDDTDATTTTETVTENIIIEDPWESHLVRWTPEKLNVSLTDIEVDKPTLESKKTAYVSEDEESKNTVVQKGGTIKYEIKVSNTGNIDANKVMIYDTIPEGTELTENLDGTIETYKDSDGKEIRRIVWEKDVKAGESISVFFKVKVTSDSINLITNKAITNGEDTNKTETPVVKTNKTASLVDGDKITKLNNNDSVKAGQTIRYTITVENKSKVDGITTISDKVPEGTENVRNITEPGELKDGTITWANVDVKAGERLEVSFDVTVSSDTKTSIRNVAIVADTDTPPVENKVANITTEKTSKASATPLKEMDTITYTLKATNSGDGEGTVIISDKIPVGTTLDGKIKFDGKEYEEKDLEKGIEVELSAGESKEIVFTVRIDPFKEGDENVNLEGEKLVRIIRNAEAKQDGKEVPPTEDKVEKEYITVDVNKKFEDKDNIDNVRPKEVTVTLYADNVATDKTATLNTENNWTAKFEKLDKYNDKNKEEISYTVKEDNVDKNYTDTYKVEKKENTTTVEITNKLKYENIKTEKTAKKIWEDNDNKVNVRPQNVTFELYKDGKATGTKQVASEKGNWTVKFSKLQKYHEDGTEIAYTVKELKTLEDEDVTIENNEKLDDHYVVTYEEDGLTVKNTIDYTTFTKNEKVNKIWIDESKTQHPTIVINLYQSGSEDVYKTITLENGNNSYTFKNLPKYDKDGNEYTYTASEEKVEGYETTYSDDKLTITNTIIDPKNVEVKGTKTWIDPEGTVHPEITINLLQNDNIIDSKKLPNGTTTYEFTGLPKYVTDGEGNYVLDDDDNVQLNKYTVEEEAVEGYKTEQKGNSFTNTINQEKLSISGIKTWIDPEGTKHPEITINLLRDGEKKDSKKLANGTTTYEFKDLDKYDLKDGHEYVYTLSEDAVEGYTTKQNGNNFTNTINQEKISVKGEKTWIDPKGTEHPEITINLLRDGEKKDSTKLANGTTTYEFKDLDKYAPDGHIYEYTVTEDAVEGYTTKQDGTNFTNTINQEKISVKGEKTWIDPKGTEHPEITINLLRDGEKKDSVKLANGTTTYEFKDLDKYAPDGHIYEYTVTEDAVEGYTTKQDGTNFTNTIKQEKISVKGEKTWIDPEGTEHPEITINLLRDGEKKDSTKLANGTTTYEFKDLDKYAPDGHIYEYTVTEDAVDGYTSERNGYNFKNTINQDNTQSLSGTKTWIDPKGTEHPEITINLLRDGEKKDSIKLPNGTTTYEFKNLEKYAPDGHIYEYTASEDAIEGYTTKQDGTNFTNTINQEKISVKGEKTWVDPKDTEHPEITINLLRDGEKKDSIKLANGTTTYEFKDLDKYAPDGHIYEYTVSEDTVEGYTTKQNGTNFTNTINQEKVSVNGTKIWIDPKGTEHPEITINLLRDGEKKDSTKLANGTTTYEFKDLDKYAPDGHIYEYTVSEDSVEGYTTKQDGTNFTNTINQEKISVKGEKTWIDPEGTEHPEITINLLRDGEKKDSTKLANGTTTYEFKDLDKYAPDGHIYTYTVSEDAVQGYTTKQNGTNFTNTINQEKISVKGEKTWIDPEGTEHPEITINLLRDGEKKDSIKLPNGTTAYEFKDLDKYAPDGHIYEYTVSEDAVEGYTTKQNGTNFTNTIKQEKISVKGKKTWKDPKGTEHPDITINLFKNGEKVDSKVLKNGTTDYEFKDLEKYNLTTGEIYTYTVSENPVEGYTSEQKGNDFINTIEQEEISISGKKTWVDQEGATNVVHPEITINLLKNGRKVDSKKLPNGTTEYTFTGLERYDLSTGEEYTYKIEEIEVANYKTTYDGYNIKNTFDQDFKGKVNITTTNVTSTTVANPIDVVFVVDISGSMLNTIPGTSTTRAKSMVTALNSAMAKVLDANNGNNNNRAGVVVFNDEASDFIPLGHYENKPLSNGTKQYITINSDGNRLTRNTKGLANTSVDIVSTNSAGGTYTQGGIKAGADMLIGENDTTYTTTVNGEEITLTRTPIIILLTDGDPTYYASNYQNATTANRSDYNGNSPATFYYNTIRTAKYSKGQVTSHYYGNTGKESKFYTIGFGMDRNDVIHNTVLNPTQTNVNNCNSNGGPWYNRNKRGQLYDLLNENGTPYAYDYADDMFIGSDSDLNLTSVLNTIVEQNLVNTTSRDITAEESAARRVELTDINTSKDFALKIGSTTYSSFSAAQSAGYVKGSSSAGYYVDLTNVEKGTNIEISYNQ